MNEETSFDCGSDSVRWVFWCGLYGMGALVLESGARGELWRMAKKSNSNIVLDVL